MTSKQKALSVLLPSCSVCYGWAIADRVARTGWHATTAAGLRVYLGRNADEAADRARALGPLFGALAR